MRRRDDTRPQHPARANTRRTAVASVRVHPEETTAVKPFSSPEECLGDLDLGAAAKVIAAACDIALVLDPDGVILDSATGVDQPALGIAGRWLGKRWADTVTLETRAKVEALLADAAAGKEPRWRQVNHPVAGGPDIPVTYCTVPIPSAGKVIAMGRDLSTVATVQRRLVDVQQSLESDYWQLRQAEARYRTLFQMASEPVVMIDAVSRRIQDANPAAVKSLGDGQPELVGQPFPLGFAAEESEAVQRLLETAATLGRAEDITVTGPDGAPCRVSASLLRQRENDIILVRLTPQESGGGGEASDHAARLATVMEHAPDCIVVTDERGVILDANRAFLDLAQLTHSHQARDESLERWLGRQGVDLDILLANLRRHGSVPLYATTLRGQQGSTSRVEVAATRTRAGEGDPLRFGFFIRNVDTRVGTEHAPMDRDHARSIEQMRQMVGQMPLKELVRESTDLIERLCIEAALELTGNNRASAAELLGLSRQSLYAKLRRHGLMNLEDG